MRDGAIGNPDLFEQDFEHYDIPEVPEKGFKSHFLLICRHKMFIFGVYRLLWAILPTKAYKHQK